MDRWSLKYFVLFPPGTWRRQKPDNYQLQTPHWQSFWNKLCKDEVQRNHIITLPTSFQKHCTQTETQNCLYSDSHVTWILAFDWSRRITWHEYWFLIGRLPIIRQRFDADHICVEPDASMLGQQSEPGQQKLWAQFLYVIIQGGDR